MVFETVIVWLGLGLSIAVLRDLCHERIHSSVNSTTIDDGSMPVAPPQHFPSQPRLHHTSTGLPRSYYWRENSQRHWRFDWSIRCLPTEDQRFQSSLTDRDVRALHRNWRLSIAGLVAMADRNIGSARANLAAQLYKEAIRDSVTGMENISRALLYCYGIEPYPDSGQDEPLRMLAARFKADERRRLQETVEKITTIVKSSPALENVGVIGPSCQVPDQRNAIAVLDGAVEVVVQFRQMIDNTFGDEVPELLAFRRNFA